MSQDFFADLERQLVAATAERGARLRRARARRAATMMMALAAVLAAGGGLAAAVTSSGGGDRTGAPAGAPTQTVTVDPRNGAIGPAPERGSYVVAVLNATTVPGMARGVATRLQNNGFKIGNVTNASTQDATTTRVLYARPDCVPAAAQVTAALVLPDAVLEPASDGVRAVAGRGADVIVLVGSDQSTAPSRKSLGRR